MPLRLRTEIEQARCLNRRLKNCQKIYAGKSNWTKARLPLTPVDPPPPEDTLRFPKMMAVVWL